MKCVKTNSTGVITRVEDETAQALVKAGKASFAPKHLWKVQRDADRKADEAERARKMADAKLSDATKAEMVASGKLTKGKNKAKVAA